MYCHIQISQTYQDRAESFSGSRDDFIRDIVSVFLVSVHQGPLLLPLLLYMERNGNQRVGILTVGVMGLRESMEKDVPYPARSDAARELRKLPKDICGLLRKFVESKV